MNIGSLFWALISFHATIIKVSRKLEAVSFGTPLVGLRSPTVGKLDAAYFFCYTVVIAA